MVESISDTSQKLPEKLKSRLKRPKGEAPQITRAVRRPSVLPKTNYKPTKSKLIRRKAVVDNPKTPRNSDDSTSLHETSDNSDDKSDRGYTKGS